MILPESLEARFRYAVKTEFSAGHSATQSYKAPTSYRLKWLRTGRLRFAWDDQKLQQCAGSVCMLPPFAPGATTVTHALQDSEWITIGFRLLVFGSIDITRRLTNASIWHPPAEHHHSLDELTRLLVAHSTATTLSATFIRDGILRTLIGLCWDPLGMTSITEGTNPRMPEWLNLAMQQIRLSPGMTVSELEKVAGYSRAHFHNVFQQYIGVPPRVYLQRYRLNLAKHLLTTTDMSVAAIAEHIGFANASDFARFFRRLAMISPSEYRLLTARDDADLPSQDLEVATP